MTAGPIYTTAEIRRIEQAAGEAPLMERAAAAAAGLAMTRGSARAKGILVLAGAGNNGGDARIAARILQERFFRVALVERPEELTDRPWGLVIDGLFGLGLARPIEGDYAKLVEYANRQSCPIL